MCLKLSLDVCTVSGGEETIVALPVAMEGLEIRNRD